MEGEYPFSSLLNLTKENSLEVNKNSQSYQSILKKSVIHLTFKFFETYFTILTIHVQICIRSFATIGLLTES